MFSLPLCLETFSQVMYIIYNTLLILSCEKKHIYKCLCVHQLWHRYTHKAAFSSVNYDIYSYLCLYHHHRVFQGWSCSILMVLIKGYCWACKLKKKESFFKMQPIVEEVYMVFTLLALLCCVRVHHERISAYFYPSLHTFCTGIYPIQKNCCVCLR